MTVVSVFGKRRAAHLALGAAGEKDAVRLLQEHGLEILARDWRCRHGELDIVARDGDCLVFVEVKTRRQVDRYRPSDNLSPRQLRRNVRAAREYLAEYGPSGCRFRFDLIEVVRTKRELLEVRRHIDFVDADLIQDTF